MDSQGYKIFSFILFLSMSFFHLFSLMGNNSIRKGVSKALLMPSLLFSYVVLVPFASPFIVGALGLSFFGDVGLFIADKKPGVSQKVSILAFALSHILYTLYIFPQEAPFLLIFFPFLGTSIILALFYIKILHPMGHTLTPLIFIYALIITIMATSSFIFLLTYQTIASLVIFSGALFFLFSDFLIAKQIIYNNKKYELAVMSTYIVAQFLLIIGFVLI
ncbi:MAG: lysoplasmalogenase [Spirochaetia bacterium]|nr:lysoplasmalogenase [Spirochaetia bacterium]